MSVKTLYKIKRFKNDDVCAFCGKKVTDKAREVRQKLLKKFPYFGILLIEIRRNRGTDFFCEEHLMVLVKQVFVVRKKRLVLHKRKVQRFAQRLYYHRIYTLVRKDAIDRLYELSQRQKKSEDVPKKISLEEFAELVEKTTKTDEAMVDVTIDDMAQMLQKPQRRRQPCWMNPPKGECVYKNSCSKAHLCGGGAYAAFFEEIQKPEKQLTHEFYWDWEPCEANCPDCSPLCPNVKWRKLKVRKVPAKPKRWRPKNHKWITKNWAFLGREGRPIDDKKYFEKDAES